MSECTCFTGYCLESEAADKAELAAIDWQDSGMADREAYGVSLIGESDLPPHAYDDDADDVGISLDRYIRGYAY